MARKQHQVRKTLLVVGEGDELWGKLGDDGLRKAAYRGGNEPSRTSREESDTPWKRIAPSSAFASPMMSMIP